MDTGRSKEKITIQAEDSVALAEARLVIRDEMGKVIERACYPAVDDGTVYWLYATRRNVPSAQVVRIEVTAIDLAGQSAAKTILWRVAGKQPVVRPLNYSI